MNFASFNQYDKRVVFEDDPQTISTSADNAGLMLVACACQLYRETFKSNTVPFAFVDFYIKEMQHYKTFFNTPINDFLNYYNKSENLELFIRMFTISGFNMATAIKKINGFDHLLLDPKNNFYIADFVDRPNSEEQKDTASKLKTAYELYLTSDELKSVQELYDDYLIENFIHNYNNENHHKLKETKQQQEPSAPSEKVLNTTVIGEKTELTNQKGKVVKLSIPSFALPLAYPVEKEHSRVLSDYTPKRFVYADKCIKVLNIHQISAVGFSVGFVEKRKSVNKKPKFNKFDFDF